MSTHIAVIGAGIAGLSCAAALREAGHQVVVFDKSRGLGGRMCTRRGDGWQFDHGAQYFTARHPRFQQQVQRWIDGGLVAPWQVTPAVIGGDHAPSDVATVRYVGVPDMPAPARALAAGLDVHTGHTINALIRDAGGWRLSSADHGELAGVYAQVVVAMPSPQAAALLAQVAPAMSTLASGPDMLPCWTVMAQLAEPPALPFDAAFVNAGPLRWVARNNSKPGRSGQEYWVLQASAQWSAEHLEDEAASVADVLLTAFRQLGGTSALTFQAHRWRYANCEAGEAGSLWDAELGIGLCGDWLHGGRVEGAWLSGHHLADRMLA